MEKLMKGKYIILISIFLIIVISITGCVDEPPSRGPWYTFADFFTPGYYYAAGQKDIYHDLVDVEKILGSTSGFSDFDGPKTLINSMDIAISAAWIEAGLIYAGSTCVSGKVTLSDTKERVLLHEALKHFGDLYNDGYPNTNPSIDDLKATKELAECYLNTYGTKSSEDKYLFDVTNALIKFLDTKISSYESAEEQSGVSDDSGKIRKIDVQVQEQSEEIVIEKVAKEVEIKPLGEGELGYDDGEKDASASMGGHGHAVFFPIDTSLIVRQVKIYGCRYDKGLKHFDLEIWDNDFRTLYSASYNYVDYFPDSHSPFGDDDFKWAILDIPDIEVYNDFYLVLFTHSSPPSWGEKEEYQRVPPHMQGGIEIGVDKDMKSGNSFVVDKNPNMIVDWPTWNLQQDSTNWMIRVSSG